MEKEFINNDLANSFLNTLSSLSRGSKYLYDFQQERFDYVCNHDLFLCGRQQGLVTKQGLDAAYREITHPLDFPCLEKIYWEIKSLQNKPDELASTGYFSFQIRLKAWQQEKNNPVYLLAYHKLSPIYQDNRLLWLALITCMPVDNDVYLKLDDRLYVLYPDFRRYNKEESGCEKYSFTTCQWRRYEPPHLTEIEIQILRLSLCGLDYATIANKLCISYDAVKKHVGVIFEKLGVHAIESAVIVAMNHSLIFRCSETKPPLIGQQPDNDVKTTKPRRTMTPEKIASVQARINNGEQNRAIAREENIAEKSIRYALGKGTLVENQARLRKKT
jgi:DNA-binding NarL/FixJ family response regulator